MQPRWIGRVRRPSYGLSWPIRWSGFVLLTAILSVATVAGMIVFTWLTLAGMRRINLGRLEKYEVGLISLLLCAVGVRLTKLQRKLHREHCASPVCLRSYVRSPRNKSTRLPLKLELLDGRFRSCQYECKFPELVRLFVGFG